MQDVYSQQNPYQQPNAAGAVDPRSAGPMGNPAYTAPPPNQMYGQYQQPADNDPRSTPGYQDPNQPQQPYGQQPYGAQQNPDHIENQNAMFNRSDQRNNPQQQPPPWTMYGQPQAQQQNTPGGPYSAPQPPSPYGQQPYGQQPYNAKPQAPKGTHLDNINSLYKQAYPGSQNYSPQNTKPYSSPLGGGQSSSVSYTPWQHYSGGQTNPGGSGRVNSSHTYGGPSPSPARGDSGVYDQNRAT